MPETSPSAQVSVGTVLRFSRRYTTRELARFAGLAELEPAGATLTYLPDLLVLAPLTKLGGDLNYISRQMTWRVHRVVGVDEEVSAELEVTSLGEGGPMRKIAFAARILDAAGDIVISGDSRGLLFAS